MSDGRKATPYSKPLPAAVHHQILLQEYPPSVSILLHFPFRSTRIRLLKRLPHSQRRPRIPHHGDHERLP